MAKKQQETVAKRHVFLGKAEGTLRMGIVGTANVGKSCTFNSLCRAEQAASENFPFCTVEPNKARVPVPDSRWEKLCDLYKPAKRCPAFLEIIDIAGLVKGAAEGAGLGNAFLSNIQSVDGIFHVIRLFEDKEIAHVEGSVDPVRDFEMIHDELRRKDVQMLEKLIEDLERKTRMGVAADMKVKLATTKRVLEHLEGGKDVTYGEWSEDDIFVINSLHLLTAKPMIYLLNMSRKDLKRQRNKFLKPLITSIQERCDGKAVIIPYCAELEAEFMHAGDAVGAMEETEGLKTMIPRIIETGYKTLQLMHYYTAGADDVHCWTVRQGSLAPEAAGVIHTDFRETFICGSVMRYDDLVEHESESKLKALGLVKQVGKTYVVEDGDICVWKAGKARGKK